MLAHSSGATAASCLRVARAFAQIRHAAPPAGDVARVLSLPPSVRVFVSLEPFDMRGSFDALAGAIRRLDLDPVNGHLYLFFNRRRRLAKAFEIPPPERTGRLRYSIERLLQFK